MTFFAQLGTSAKVPSGLIAAAPTFPKVSVNVRLDTVLVPRSTFLRVPALFCPMMANTGTEFARLIATLPSPDMYPLAYPSGAVPNMLVSQVEYSVPAFPAPPQSYEPPPPPPALVPKAQP
jgi:hypothetical protein